MPRTRRGWCAARDLTSRDLPDHVAALLAGHGVQLSIDDYGTGYSSLSYIMRLPVKELKIDQAFVSRMSENPDLATIVHSTIELGHSLGLKVVAEGVEDSRELALLRELGCDSAQGYYLSPPIAPADFITWLEGSLPPRGLAAASAGSREEAGPREAAG